MTPLSWHIDAVGGGVHPIAYLSPALFAGVPAGLRCRGRSFDVLRHPVAFQVAAGPVDPPAPVVAGPGGWAFLSYASRSFIFRSVKVPEHLSVIVLGVRQRLAFKLLSGMNMVCDGLANTLFSTRQNLNKSGD